MHRITAQNNVGNKAILKSRLLVGLNCLP